MAELFTDVDTIEEILVIQKRKVQEIIDTKDNGVVMKMKTIEELVKEKIDVIHKIGIPDFKIHYELVSDSLINLDRFINTMYSFKIVPTEVEEVTNLLEESFLIEKSWICHNCSNKNETLIREENEPTEGSDKHKIKTAELE